MGSQDTHAFSAKVTSATTDTQIFTAPWRIRRRYFVTALILTNENVAANTIKFYDKDTASATPPVRGDNLNAPLLEFIVPAGSTLIFTDQQLPKEFFQAGMVANASVNNIVVMTEVLED